MKINKNYTSYTHAFTPENAIDISNLKVYPNPTNDILNVYLEREYFVEGSAINIYNADGKLVISNSIEVGANNMAINTAVLQKGIYIARLNNGYMKEFNFKFIKN